MALKTFEYKDVYFDPTDQAKRDQYQSFVGQRNILIFDYPEGFDKLDERTDLTDDQKAFIRKNVLQNGKEMFPHVGIPAFVNVFQREPTLKINVPDFWNKDQATDFIKGHKLNTTPGTAVPHFDFESLVPTKIDVTIETLPVEKMVEPAKKIVSIEPIKPAENLVFLEAEIQESSVPFVEIEAPPNVEVSVDPVFQVPEPATSTISFAPSISIQPLADKKPASKNSNLLYAAAALLVFMVFK